MNYYPFHVGDYSAHTRHLSLLEDLAYRRLLDLYYLREAPLPAAAEQVARLVAMRDNVEEVGTVLAEFFALTPDGWTHTRCDVEIAKMQDKQAKARASGLASANARSTNVQRTLNERSTDVQLPTPTPTPTPTPNNGKVKSIVAALFVDVDPQIAEDWQAMRRQKKAAVTATAIDGIRAEAMKAGLSLQDALAMCCARGWSGFKAEWLKENNSRAPPGMTPYQQMQVEKHEQSRAFNEAIHGKGSNGRSTREPIDITPAVVG